MRPPVFLRVLPLNRVGALCLALVAGISSSGVTSAVDGPAPGSLTPETLTLPSGPASIRGLAADPTVSLFSGQVSYQVPIELPVGPGGFAPSFALSYDGGRGNGPLGLGWSLDFPRVEHSLRLGVPSFSDADELELRGLEATGRMVAALDGSYRVEGAGQAVRVQRSGALFLATDSDGVRYYMGFTPSGRQADGSRIVAWLTQYIQHPTGQGIGLEYTSDQGQVYLSRLVWGPDGAFEASLSYESRPDQVISYRSGFKVVTAWRLAAIEVRAFGEVLRTYRLAYSDAFPLSRLLEVQMTGRGGVDALPPISFTYSTPAPGEAAELSGGLGWTPAMPDVALVDVDGDAMADLTRLALGDHRYWRNLGGRFDDEERVLAGASDTSLASGTLRLMDMDGDSRAELVRSAGPWSVYRLTAGGWVDLVSWLGTSGLPLVSPDYAFADLNGDGRTDVIQRSGLVLLVRLNGDGGLEAPASVPSFDGAPLPGELQLRFQDANGDGLADAIRLTGTSATIHLGRGDGTFDTPYSIAFPFFAVDLANLWLADLNRDGLLDLVHVEGGDVSWYAVHTDGSLDLPVLLPRPSGVGTVAKVDIADVNGNGSADVVWSTNTGMWCLDLAGPVVAGMLVRVENGLGKSIGFEYAASARLALEDEIAGEPWVESLPVSIPVAVETRSELVSGDPSRRTSYRVRDGFYDGEERRFGGFRSGVTTQHGAGPSQTLVETTFFHTGLGADRVLRGRPYRREQRDGTGKLFQVQLEDWVALELAGLSGNPLLRVPRRVLAETEIYEGEEVPVRRRIAYTYDDQGNEIESFDDGRSDRLGDEIVIQRTFAHNDDIWVRGRVVEEESFDGEGGWLVRRRTRYDGVAGPLPLGELDLGRPRRVESYLADEDRWIVVREVDYDAFGNPVRIYEDGVMREIGYDASGLFPITETQRATPTRTLTWTTEWDPVLAQPVRSIDPNGVATEAAFDGLGRVVSLSTDGVLTQTFAYDWTAPTPTQTTTRHEGDLNGDGVLDDGDLRLTVAVANSAGESLYQASMLDDASWVLSGGRRYDARGEVVFAADPLRWSATALPGQLPPGAVGQTVEYDALGRVLVKRLPGGEEQAVGYGRFQTTVSSPGLGPVTHQADGQGRVILTERRLKKRGDNRAVERTETDRDGLGRITAISVAGGRAIHSYSYDSLGRLTSATDPDSGSRSYLYDDAGRVTRVSNDVGQQISYQYDAVGRLLRIDGDLDEAVVVHYDEPLSGSAAAKRTLGRPAWIEEGTTGRLEYSYDAFGRPVETVRTIAGVTAVESVVVSPSGLLLQQSFGDGFAVAYRYDRAGRPLSVEGLWEVLERDAAGRILRERFGNGVEQSYLRNILGLPVGIRVQASSADLLHLAVNYNPYGAVQLVDDVDGTGLDHGASFAYDPAARLTVAGVGGAVFSYGYDRLQNLVSRQVAGGSGVDVLAGVYRYGEGGAGPRQLTSAGGQSFSYDAAGRMVATESAALTYDARDRMTRVDLATGESVTYRYGHDGERTLAIGPKAHQERRFSAALVERDGRRQHYVSVGDRVLARVDLELEKGAWVERGIAYHHRGIGVAATLITDAGGKVRDERLYEPFGGAIAADQRLEAVGWGGKPVEEATGWADHGARWYAPRRGQWMVPDPVVLAPSERFVNAPWGLNPYQYVSQNPVLYWDPDGREEKRITVEAQLDPGKNTIHLIHGDSTVSFSTGRPWIIRHSDWGSRINYVTAEVRLTSYRPDEVRPSFRDMGDARVYFTRVGTESKPWGDPWKKGWSKGETTITGLAAGNMAWLYRRTHGRTSLVMQTYVTAGIMTIEYRGQRYQVGTEDNPVPVYFDREVREVRDPDLVRQGPALGVQTTWRSLIDEEVSRWLYFDEKGAPQSVKQE